MGKPREAFWAYDEDHDDDFEDPFADEDLIERDDSGAGFEEFGCVCGAACCMPEIHFPSECYTAEMAEAYYQEAEEADSYV